MLFQSYVEGSVRAEGARDDAKTLVVAAGDALFVTPYIGSIAKSTTTHASPCTTRAQASLHST